jgi:aminoglycoside phosphotransferase
VGLAAGGRCHLVWRNELGGLTFRLDGGFVKWNPRRTGNDLEKERLRLQWLETRHPVPRVITWGQDEQAQWLVTTALPGEHAVGDTSRPAGGGDHGDRQRPSRDPRHPDGRLSSRVDLTDLARP